MRRSAMTFIDQHPGRWILLNDRTARGAAPAIAPRRLALAAPFRPTRRFVVQEAPRTPTVPCDRYRPPDPVIGRTRIPAVRRGGDARRADQPPRAHRRSGPRARGSD